MTHRPAFISCQPSAVGYQQNPSREELLTADSRLPTAVVYTVSATTRRSFASPPSVSSAHHLPYGEGMNAKEAGNWFAHPQEPGLLRTGHGVPPPQQHLQASSDIGGSGGVPRRATARETEARSAPAFLARIVNTEGPGS